jgi:7-keto-8-aminopelargonate synthetase-like enzyme
LLVAQGLAGEVSHVLLDEKAHGCLQDAAQWLNLPTIHFRHRDAAALRKALASLPRGAHPLVGTDGMFAADGALAPLPELAAVLPKNAWLWIDDSHGAGTLGRSGQGTLEELGQPVPNLAPRLIRTLTLSKALGGYGGAVLGAESLRQRIIERSRLFTGNTPLPPLFAAAALTALDRLRREPGLRRRLRGNVTRLRQGLAAAGWPVADSPAPVMALVPDSASGTKTLRRRLLKDGLFPSFIEYPGGPQGGFLRLAVSSEHTADQIDQLVHSLRRG